MHWYTKVCTPVTMSATLAAWICWRRNFSPRSWRTNSSCGVGDVRIFFFGWGHFFHNMTSLSLARNTGCTEIPLDFLGYQDWAVGPWCIVFVYLFWYFWINFEYLLILILWSGRAGRSPLILRFGVKINNIWHSPSLTRCSLVEPARARSGWRSNRVEQLNSLV